MTSSSADTELEFELWQHMRPAEPALREVAEPDEASLQPPTAEELEVLRQTAYEEGLAAGRAEGLRQAAEEVRVQAESLRALIGCLARPLEQLDARVEEELVALVIAMVRQLVRREIKTDPGVIVAALQQALGVLPLAAREIAVKVHPEDAALLRGVYAETGEEQVPGWRIVETPAVTRGGCVVVTSTSEVDATVERRLTAAIRSVFGSDRLGDAGATAAEAPQDNEQQAGQSSSGPGVARPESAA